MIGIEEIKGILPHRYPFLLVDKVVSVDSKNGSIICLKNVTANEPHFNGHFPQEPIMPGVLILEAMAQAAGILSSQVKGGESVNEQSIYYLAGADNIRFRQPVVPGDQLILKARLLAHRCNVWKFSCEAVVDGKIVCSADITSAKKDVTS